LDVARFSHGDIPETFLSSLFLLMSSSKSLTFPMAPTCRISITGTSNDLKVITAHKGALLVELCPSDDDGVGCDDGGGVT
jgi:hypothetical protein